MVIDFIDGGAIRETHHVDLDLDPANFYQSLGQAILDLRAHGQLGWVQRVTGVTLPHEYGDEQHGEDELGELRQNMEIAVWCRPWPEHHVARERRMRIRLGRYRYEPY